MSKRKHLARVVAALLAGVGIFAATAVPADAAVAKDARSAVLDTGWG